MDATHAANGSGGNGGPPDRESAPGANGSASHAHPAVTRRLWSSTEGRADAPTAADETVDVGALARTLAKGWRTVLAGAVLGAVVGFALVLLVAPWYRGTASVLIRNANDPTGSLLSRFGVTGDLAGAAAGGALGGVLKSSLETEVQLLQSRELAGKVVDSLALQARVFEPRGLPSATLFAPGPIGGQFRKRSATFTRESDGAYRVVAGDSASRIAPGRTAHLAGIGQVSLATGQLPARFRVQFEDREDAITRALDHLSVEKLGGDVVKVRYSGPDSLSAAAVPNALLAAYLTLRRTVDRGLNERRYEFMAAQADTAARQLASAEDALRREAEQTGVLDPELTGKTAAEAIQQVRSQVVPLEAERRAAHALIDAVDAGTLGPRQIAAFPSFLRSPGINSILSQVNQLQAERSRLLGGRTERDPDVVVLGQTIADLERGLLPLARTYAASLDRQTQQLTAEQGAVQARLGTLPGAAERTLRAQRDVRRLSQVVLGLQAQMIDARLAAISEGGQVRQVDIAQPPKRPLFPRAIWTVPGGLLLGVLGAIAWVLGRATWSERVRSADDAERATGLNAVTLRRDRRVLLPDVDLGTVVVLGLTENAPTRTVAESLAGLARARGRTTVVIDGHAGAPATGGTVVATAVRESLARADATADAVYVTVEGLDDERTLAVLEPGRPVALVVEEGVSTRRELSSTTAMLTWLGSSIVGVIVAPSARAARRR